VQDAAVLNGRRPERRIGSNGGLACPAIKVWESISQRLSPAPALEHSVHPRLDDLNGIPHRESSSLHIEDLSR
jgi:hypothetical protein